ncbi:hypothetical protein BLOT_005997 [Blomia tropicalis]|nr:hypothetical protein BLOT_005997 [Blomia tropicalis]
MFDIIKVIFVITGTCTYLVSYKHVIEIILLYTQAVIKSNQTSSVHYIKNCIIYTDDLVIRKCESHCIQSESFVSGQFSIDLQFISNLISTKIKSLVGLCSMSI